MMMKLNFIKKKNKKFFMRKLLINIEIGNFFLNFEINLQ